MMRFRKKLFGASPKVSIGGVATNALMVGLPAYGMIQAHKEGKVAEKQSKASVEEMDKMTQAMNAKTRELDRKFEKSFGLPALLGSGALMVGTTGAQMLQSNSQMKKQEKMNGKQIAAQNRQTRAIQRQNELLNKIAEKGGSDAGQKAAEVLLPPNQAAPEKKKEADESFFSQRSFASVNWNSVKSVGRDLLKASKAAGVNSSIKNTLKSAAGITVAGYAVNKAIQHDMKKSGLDVDKSGNLVQKTKPQLQQQRAYSILDKALGPALTLSFEAPRYLSYRAEKKRLMNQVAATSPNQPQQVVKKPRTVLNNQKPIPQKQFSIMGSLKNIPGKLKAGWGTFNKHRVQTLTGGLMKIGSFGQFGTKNVQKFGGSLGQSTNQALSRAGKWIQANPAKANVAALAPAVAIGSTLFTKSQKAMKKGMEKIDPDAYKYQNSKDQAAENQKNASKAQMG